MTRAVGGKDRTRNAMKKRAKRALSEAETMYFSQAFAALGAFAARDVLAAVDFAAIALGAAAFFLPARGFAGALHAGFGVAGVSASMAFFQCS